MLIISSSSAQTILLDIKNEIEKRRRWQCYNTKPLRTLINGMIGEFKNKFRTIFNELELCNFINCSMSIDGEDYLNFHQQTSVLYDVIDNISAHGMTVDGIEKILIDKFPYECSVLLSQYKISSEILDELNDINV